MKFKFNMTFFLYFYKYKNEKGKILWKKAAIRAAMSQKMVYGRLKNVKIFCPYTSQSSVHKNTLFLTRVGTEYLNIFQPPVNHLLRHGCSYSSLFP